MFGTNNKSSGDATRRLKPVGLGLAAAGLAVLLGLAAQLVIWPDAEPGLLLITAEGAAGIVLITIGFAIMVAAADPFADVERDSTPDRS